MGHFHDQIEIQPDKRFGQPCIKGTRITVHDILSMLGSGMSNQEIMEDFPELSVDQIKAALHFAADREQTLRVVS
jgi:uncharacterized protein (DUF433 family)